MIDDNLAGEELQSLVDADEADVLRHIEVKADTMQRVLFAFAWKQENRRPILVKSLRCNGRTLISIYGDDDVGIEGNAGSPAIFRSGWAVVDDELKFEWSVRLLDHIDWFGAFIRVGDGRWAPLKKMDAAGYDKEWEDKASYRVPAR